MSINDLRKNSQDAQGKLPHKPNTWLLLAVSLILVAIIGGIVWAALTVYGAIFSPSSNRAERSAAPFEQALIAHGATKECGYGDDGRGLDNLRPWYNGYFELPLARDKAIDLLTDIATTNGYHLVHASAANRGPNLPADAYLDDWYFDNQQQSHYSDLSDGPILLAVSVNNSKNMQLSNVSCKTASPVQLAGDAEHTAVTITVSLPDVKR